MVGAELRKAPRAVIVYADLRDPETLEPAPQTLCGATLLVLAVYMRPIRGEGPGVRQIDNCVLLPRGAEVSVKVRDH